MNEEILFQLIKTIVKDLQKRNPFSYRDGYSPKYDLTIELKCRHKHYDDLLIEKMKWDKLVQHKNVRYINSTPIGIFSFNLHKIQKPIWNVRDMPMHTEFANTYDIKKIVGFLNIYDADNLSHLLKFYQPKTHLPKESGSFR